MLHCVCCNQSVQPWQEFCLDCEEAIQHVYSEDSKYARFLKGIHPYAIPKDFVSVNYDWSIDTI